MPSLKRSILAAFDDFRASGLLRPAAEKFAGAWLACFLVMARGDVLAGLSFEHIRLASICGIVGLPSDNQNQPLYARTTATNTAAPPTISMARVSLEYRLDIGRLRYKGERAITLPVTPVSLEIVQPFTL